MNKTKTLWTELSSTSVWRHKFTAGPSPPPFPSSSSSSLFPSCHCSTHPFFPSSCFLSFITPRNSSSPSCLPFHLFCILRFSPPADIQSSKSLVSLAPSILISPHVFLCPPYQTLSFCPLPLYLFCIQSHSLPLSVSLLSIYNRHVRKTEGSFGAHPVQTVISKPLTPLSAAPSLHWQLSITKHKITE